MPTFILRRLAAGIVLVFVITTVAYAILYASSGDVARKLLGENATDEQVAAKTAELGLDRPLLTQYWDWLSDALSGDFGTSYVTGRSVATTVADRFPVTLSMVLVAITVTALISIALGMTAAIRGGWTDRVLQVVSVVGFSLPNFWIALVLILTFAINRSWFPATGYVGLLDDPVDWARSLVLPVTALAVSATASASQQIRGAVRDVLELDFVRTLQSRGLGRRSVLFRHVLRNAAPPALTVLSLQFIGLLGGAVVIEQVFGMRGLGTLTVQSALDTDIPQLMAIVVLMVILVVIVNLVIDIVNGWLNPKARLA
jgi:peptide/nickel transport system permease protein